MPVFSIVMPAYNVGKYIGEAIKSVLRQTFADWELVIVDDGSTDNTLELAQYFSQQDNRIRCFTLPSNSGGCFIPRAEAVLKSTGHRIVNLDADDYLEDFYLEKIYNRIQETHVDAILGRMYCIKNDLVTDTIPKMDFDIGQVISGEQACMFTVPRWIIGLSGAIPKEIYVTAIQQHDAYKTLHAADEVLSRRLLLLCNNVAFVDAKYMYRYNENSVTHKFALKLFDRIDTDRLLLTLLEEHFGKYSSEVQVMHQQVFEGVLSCEVLYWKNRRVIDKKDRTQTIDRLRAGYSMINWGNCQGKVPPPSSAIFDNLAFRF